MNRVKLIEQLDLHRAENDHEDEMRSRIMRFVSEHENCADRSLKVGHLTGSAWIVDRDCSHALLTHHRKLDLWVQLGGHVEGETEMLAASWREAREESGLFDIEPVCDRIFDVDVHVIPERSGEPRHFHYDIRFLFQADRCAPLTVTSESKDLAWVALDRIADLTAEESVVRMVRKTISRGGPVSAGSGSAGILPA